MEKVTFPKDYKLYLPLLVLFAVLVFLLPKTPKFSYDYAKGSPWMHENLVASFDFPILKTDEQIQAEVDQLGSRRINYYRYSSEVRAAAEQQVSDLDLGEKSGLKPVLASELSALYEKGILPDKTEGQSNADDFTIYVQRDKRAKRYSASELMTESEAREWLIAVLTESRPSVNADSLLRSCDFEVRPNLFYDEAFTSMMHQKSADFVSPTAGVVTHGTMLVHNGEIVTGEIKQLLDSYKVEYDKSVGYDGHIEVLWAGTALIALIIVMLLFMSIFYGNRYVMNPESYNKYLYLLNIFLLSTVVTLVIDKYAPNYIMMVPYSLFAIYLQSFFRKRVVMPAYITSLLPLLLSAQNGSEMFLMHLFAGIVCMFSFSYLDRGWKQFVNALVIFVATFVVWLAFRMYFAQLYPFDWRSVLMLGLAAFFCVLGYPVINLFEILFNLVSSQRLTDLCDTNSNKLLRELQEKAPGTFQHSLQVANLAEHAARSINCDALLTRTGALYHDIGKINNPMCFVENQPEGRGTYHSERTPLESARDIIKHVNDGMELARKNNLPNTVRQFILTHHGTTSVSYFLAKYKNSDAAIPAMYGEFYYKGNRPKTKEQSIVMICDTIEAASRTLMDFSAASVDAFVEAMFRGKMTEDGDTQDQFEDSELTMAEFKLIKKALKDYLTKIHHARISYPGQEKPQKPAEPQPLRRKKIFKF